MHPRFCIISENANYLVELGLVARLKYLMLVQLLYLAFITPVVYDFYNYDMERPEFVQLFVKFAQVCVYSTFSRELIFLPGCRI